MSLLDRSNKNTTFSTASEQLIEEFKKVSGYNECSIESGVFNIYDNSTLTTIFMRLDMLELIMTSKISKLAGIKEICFHKNVGIIVTKNTQLNKDIVIRSNFDINFEKSYELLNAFVQDLNVNCTNFQFWGDDFKLINSIITAKWLWTKHNVMLVNCEKNIKN